MKVKIFDSAEAYANWMGQQRAEYFQAGIKVHSVVAFNNQLVVTYH